MSESKHKLYEQIILDHNKNPRNFYDMDEASLHLEGNNSLCGDIFTIYLKMDGDTIVDASFNGKGCAVSKSSASMMVSEVKGKSKEEAQKLFSLFTELITSNPDSPVKYDELGTLAAFSGLRKYPVRIKCATLAWETMLAALEGETTTVSTERTDF